MVVLELGGYLQRGKFIYEGDFTIFHEVCYHVCSVFYNSVKTVTKNSKCFVKIEVYYLI